jgi:2-oxoglutarate ferredoxin oxidoreductase subunit alpha
MAPGSVGDCLLTTQWAVHLAEAMQTPAIVLSDQFLGQTEVIVEKPADTGYVARRRLAEGPLGASYRRYALTPDGVSPMSVPGMAGGQYTADGLTHNERGTPSSKASDHERQLDKRLRKIAGFDYGPHWAEIEGDGDYVILTWGSLTGPAREAARRLGNTGIPTRVVSLRLIAPLQVGLLQDALGGRRALVVEQNHGGQLYRYLRSRCDLPLETRTLNRPGPQPIRPGEIAAVIEAWRAR